MGRELSLQNSSNRYQGLYTAAKAKFEELKDTLEEMEQLREDEGEEHKATSKALKLLQKKRAGLSSSLARARNRLEKDRKEEVKTREVGCQTHLTMPACREVQCWPSKPCQACSCDKLARLVRVEGRDTKELKVFRCEGEYGAPLYARFPITLRTKGGVAALARKSLQRKAGMVVEAMELLAGGEGAATKANTKLLLGNVLQLFPELLEELVSANPQLLKQMLTLTPTEAVRFTLGAGLCLNQTRKIASMLERLRGIRLFGAEAKRRQQLVSATSLVTTDKLHTMKLMVKQTGRSKFASLCAAVKVADLPGLLKELVAEVRQSEFQAGSLQDLDAPQYQGLLRVNFGGDKGGKVFRFGVEVGGAGLHLVGALGAHDSHENIERFLAAKSDWSEQLRDLVRHGLVVADREGVERRMEVQLVLFGDKAFISEVLGLQGSAATYPIVWDLTSSKHLRMAHQDGSPHLPTIRSCHAATRTLESLDQDYWECRLDTRNGGSRVKNGKNHHSVVQTRLIDLRSLNDVAISILHIWLLWGITLTTFATLVCRVQDGNASMGELFSVPTKCAAELEEKEQQDEHEEEQDEDHVGDKEDHDDKEDDDEEGGEEEEELTPAVVAQRLHRAEVEKALVEQAAVVNKLERWEVEVAEELRDKEFLARRVELLVAEKRKQLEVEVKKKYRVTRMNRGFIVCGVTCLLTRYDTDPVLVVCPTCTRPSHKVCEVVAEEEVLGREEGEMVFTPLVDQACRECSTTASFDHQKQELGRQRDVRVARLQHLHAKLGEAKLVMTARGRRW